MPKSTSDGYVPELDGLRGIAILLVMIHRTFPRMSGSTPWPVEAGWAGVDLFFVISGFLIAGILIDTRNEKHYLRNFYVRRVLRIFPLFYLLIGGMFIAFPLLGSHAFIHESGSPLWYLLQLGNLPEGILGKNPPYWLAPTWSLAIEEQFYWTFPLLVAAVAPRKLARWLVGFAALAIVARIATTIAMPGNERVQYQFTLCRIDTIAAGCLLAVLVRWERFSAVRHRLPRWLGIVALAAAGIAIATHLDRTTVFGRTAGYSVVAIGFAALVLLVVLKRDTRSTAALRWAPLRYLGKICFGLYLLHRPADTVVTAVAAKLHLGDHGIALVPVKIAVAIVFATVSWFALETPCLRLKKYFSSKSHPARIASPRVTAPATVLAGVVLLVMIGCNVGSTAIHAEGNTAVDAGTSDASEVAVDAAPLPDSPPDVPPPPPPVLYTEGHVQSPITSDLAAHLGSIIASGTTDSGMFSKVGDSITENSYFLYCFGGAANQRNSLAAHGGWSTYDVLAGTPSALESELAAVHPRYAIVMLGTNDLRAARPVDIYGANLWTIVDAIIATGAVPVLSTIPQLYESSPSGNPGVVTYNHVIRAIAQGRQIPLVDYHLAMDPLPRDGISSDDIHPTVSPDGACQLTSAGLQYGYNMRNATAREALDRARRGAAGQALDTNVQRREGRGTYAAPFTGTLPLVDLGDTRRGELSQSAYSCGLTATGHEVVYRVDLAQTTTIDAYVVDRNGVNVDVAILAGSASASACVGGGDSQAAATVGPGPAYIVVDSRGVSTEGEYLLVVQPR